MANWQNGRVFSTVDVFPSADPLAPPQEAREPLKGPVQLDRHAHGASIDIDIPFALGVFY